MKGSIKGLGLGPAPGSQAAQRAPLRPQLGADESLPSRDGICALHTRGRADARCVDVVPQSGWQCCGRAKSNPEGSRAPAQPSTRARARPIAPGTPPAAGPAPQAARPCTACRRRSGPQSCSGRWPFMLLGSLPAWPPADSCRGTWTAPPWAASQMAGSTSSRCHLATTRTAKTRRPTPTVSSRPGSCAGRGGNPGAGKGGGRQRGTHSSSDTTAGAARAGQEASQR